MIHDVLATIGSEHQPRFRAFLAAPQEPADVLERELDAYVEMLRHMSTRIRAVDFGLVQKVAHVCRTLLHLPELTTEGSALTNAAVRYFLRKEEDYDETTAVLSFHDDVEILNAVSRSIDRQDLVIRP